MDSIKKIKEAIYERRPILKKIMMSHGKKKLYDYARGYLEVNPAPGLDERKPELIAAVQELLEKRLGKKVAQAVTHQLKKIPLVSTSDHHGIIGNPFFLNSNIIGSLHLTSDSPSYLVDFAFACISLNNSSYPRCLEFHGEEEGAGHLIRLPLLPDKLKEGVAYATRAMNKADINRAQKELQKHLKAGQVTKTRAKTIEDLLESLFLHPSILQAPDFNTQITLINHQLWPQFFKEKTAVPSLIYLEIETLVIKLLLRHHLVNHSSLIYRLLFDPAWQNFTQYPWFWGIDKRGHRVRLKKEESAWTPDSLQKALQKKEFYPGSLLCYLMVSLYYGMKCLGGFCQVHELSALKKTWQYFLIEHGEAQEANAINPVQTKELGGDGMVLAYLKTASGKKIPATGMDLYLQNPKLSMTDYQTLAQNVTLEEIMSPMLPSIYQIIYPMHERLN